KRFNCARILAVQDAQKRACLRRGRVGSIPPLAEHVAFVWETAELLSSRGFVREGLTEVKGSWLIWLSMDRFKRK
ncbi:MAG: hypothetical protein AAGK70_17000, partial [Pseudomonadota bacterium]